MGKGNPAFLRVSRGEVIVYFHGMKIGRRHEISFLCLSKENFIGMKFEMDADGFPLA